MLQTKIIMFSAGAAIICSVARFLKTKADINGNVHIPSPISMIKKDCSSFINNCKILNNHVKSK